MDRTFKITNEFCLFIGDILDYDNPDIDESKISKVNPVELEYVQSCNEYKIGQILEKYPEFLIADKLGDPSAKETLEEQLRRQRLRQMSG